MARNAQISRIYNIIQLIDMAPQGLTAQDLCDRLQQRGHEAGKRTVYRDLQALQKAGFPLFEKGTSSEGAKRWTLEGETKIKGYLVLSYRELIGLYMAKSMLKPLRDTPFFDDLEGVFRKIEENLGSKQKDFLESLGDEFQFEPGPRWGLGIDPDVVETVRSACGEKQVLKVVYASANSGTTRERRLGPHYLYFFKGSLYLVAEDLGDGKVKTFAIPRMSEVAMVDETYEGEIAEPAQLFGSSFGIFKGKSPVAVKVKFMPPVAGYVRERRWHASQRVVSLGDGSIELGMEVAVTPDLVQWVLGYGEDAVVVEPVELREEVVRRAQGVVERYG